MECGPAQGDTIDDKVAEWNRFWALQDEYSRDESPGEHDENSRHRMAMFLSGLSAEDLERFKSLQAPSKASVDAMESTTASVGSSASEVADLQQQLSTRMVESMEKQSASRVTGAELSSDESSPAHVELPPAIDETLGMDLSPTRSSDRSDWSENTQPSQDTIRKSNERERPSKTAETLLANPEFGAERKSEGASNLHPDLTSPLTNTVAEAEHNLETSFHSHEDQPSTLRSRESTTTLPSLSNSDTTLRGTPASSQATGSTGKCATETEDSITAGTEQPTDTSTGSTREPTTEPLGDNATRATPLRSVESDGAPAAPRRKPLMTVDTVPSHTCSMCPGKRTLSCKDCGIVSYCSKLCRNLDHPAHRLLCSTWKDFQTPPDRDCRRAIIIPENPHAGDVSFVWLKFHENMNDDGQCYDIPLLGRYFANKSERVTHELNYNAVLGRHLEHTVNVVSLVDNGSPFIELNEAVADLTDVKFAHKWKGTILVYGTEGISQPLSKRHDVDLHDFRHVLDHLNAHQSTAVQRFPHSNDNTPVEEDDIRYYGPTVRGVRVLCDGEILPGLKRRDRYQEVRIPLTHAVFQQTSLLPNASKVGISIYKTKYPRTAQYEGYLKDYIPDASVRKMPNESDWNPVLRALDVDCSMEGDGKGARECPDPLGVPWVKKFYQANAILARADRKPLYSAHFEALYVFNKFWLEPKWMLASNIYNYMTMEEVEREEITPDKFALYYSHVYTSFRSRGDLNVPSPYEVKKRRGTLKRKRPNGSSASSKRGKWEWSSDGDEDDVEKIEDE